jgi:hypothetical protein
MIESVDPALESSCVGRSIKELRRNAQSTDLITSCPSATNLVCLTTHVVNQRRKCARAADDLAWPEKKLDRFVRKIRGPSDCGGERGADGGAHRHFRYC